MDIKKIIRKFVANNIINENNVDDLLDKQILSYYSLNRAIKVSFEMLNDYIKDLSFGNSYYIVEKINKYVDFIYILCNERNFSENEIIYNRERIRKATISLSAYANKYKSDSLKEASEKLDNIILDKNIYIKEFESLIIDLIDMNENLNIIKKFISEYKKIISLDKTNLFDHSFQKTINSLNTNDNIYYYITLLRILYTPGIDKNKYLNLLNNFKDNKYYNELISIINGNRFPLSKEGILEKYGIEPIPEVITPNIILPKKSKDNIFTIDGDKTSLRDDGLSIKKEGKNFLVGIHIADAGRTIEPYSDIDTIAKKNFKCVYRYGNTRILPNSYEKELSLNASSNKNVISLYVLMNDSGEILDYYLKNHSVLVDRNLSYLQSDNIINNKDSRNSLKRSLEELFNLSMALEYRDKRKTEYWKKKNESKSENYKNTSFKSDMIIREFMGLYNTLLGEHCMDKNIHYIYRYQDSEYLTDLIKANGLEDYSYITDIAKHTYLDSKYSSKPKYHSGLGISNYTQSCDPLRKYPDLYNQYLLHKFAFKNKNFDFDEEEFEKLIEYFNQRNTELQLMRDEYKRALRYNK